MKDSIDYASVSMNITTNDSDCYITEKTPTDQCLTADQMSNKPEPMMGYAVEEVVQRADVT